MKPATMPVHRSRPARPACRSRHSATRACRHRRGRTETTRLVDIRASAQIRTRPRFRDMDERERSHSSSKYSGSSSLLSSSVAPSESSESSSSSSGVASSGVSMPKAASKIIGGSMRRIAAPSPIGTSRKAAPSASQNQKVSNKSRHLSLRQLLQKERRSGANVLRCRAGCGHRR